MPILPKRLQALLSFFWKRQFVRDVLTLQAGSVFAFGLGFLKSIAFARLLGLEGFGLYAVAASFMGTLKIFTGFGQEQALITYLAEKFEEKDQKGMEAVLKYFWTLTLLAAGLLLLMAALSPTLAGVFYGDNAWMIGTMVAVGFLSFIVSLPHTLVISLLQIVHRVRIMTICENAGQLLQLLLGIGFVLAGFGPLGILLGLFAANMVMTVIYAVILWRIQREYHIPGVWQSLGSRQPYRQYFTQGMWIAADKNVINFYPQTLQFLLSLFATPEVVGIAQLALKVANLPSGLLFSHTVRLANTTIPAMKSKGIDYLRTHCALLVKHTLLFHALLIFGSMLVMPFAVILAYGWEFSPVIVPALWILMIRLLQPFNVANTSLLRLFRKMHVSTIWNAIRIPIELAIFFSLPFVFHVEPLTAFVIAIFLHQLGAFSMNFYVYPSLLGFRVPWVGAKSARNHD